MLEAADWLALWVTLKLAVLVTVLLMVLVIPLTWWLARTQSYWKAVIIAVSGLPLVLPPTVMGFYLLVLLGPQGPVGQLMHAMGIGVLPFSFQGLVVASMVYSLPFAVQPLLVAFESVDNSLLEAASTLRAGAWQQFRYIALPLAKSGLVSSAVLTFAHTVGEFGVVLMIGGNIPGRTLVMSVQIYNHVEAFEYAAAQHLALGMLLFSLFVLGAVYGLRSGRQLHV